jgi:hypothetical protein
MARKKAAQVTSRPLTTADGVKYFDATFTAKERETLRRKLMDLCGYRSRPAGHICFERDILQPAEDLVWPAFVGAGLTYDADRDRLDDYTLIHICRELEFDYKAFAANTPKLPIDGFVECAKRAFPEFKHPRNVIETKIQEHKLHALWCDWSGDECVRTGCTCESHWLCSDRFVKPDYSKIIGQIAEHNETRPKFAPPKLVYSRD